LTFCRDIALGKRPGVGIMTANVFGDAAISLREDRPYSQRWTACGAA
jgi:hypothetical protein